MTPLPAALKGRIINCSALKMHMYQMKQKGASEFGGSGKWRFGTI